MMKLDEIAALAGVSRTTASYVINGKADQYRISQATRDKVMAVVTAHNYQPDSRAASLRGGQTKTLGFILPDLENASYAKLAKRLEQGARAQGYQLLIVCSEDEPATEKELAQMLVSRHVDALLVASCLPPDDPFYGKLQAQGSQILAIDRAMAADKFVTVASHSAARHLCEGDHFSRLEGYRLIKDLHQQLGQLPEALITTSYILMEGVLDYLLEQEIDMSQLAMATFGDDRLLDFLPFGINSLPQQHDALASQALELALKAVNGEYQTGLHYVSRTLKRRR
ncbi:DNA-binding transcriptional regulator FruR [Aeromonas veronii]|uniref:LacI family DNA-binding transcriptional regulator n=1 Tax=Aeromonas veronii TaxID=654 RepID=UPI0005A95CC6|nr:LacI family DNA-binding transcriptional regulator [Aeromonas veronii]OKP42239.1 DNA-binding transcriptional regulator FruR [Aeromonas veronii]